MIKTFGILRVSAILLAFVLFSSCWKDKTTTIPGTVIDIDGNVYNTIIIGKQVWMKENLKVTRYNNGDSIINVIDSVEWSALKTGAWSYYMNDPQYNNLYGKLYNNSAVIDPRKICPKGWHLSSDDEWTTLETYIGGSSMGGALKEAGTSHWLSPNTGATNSSGFTALPGGFRGGNGGFTFNGIPYLGSLGLWWTSTGLWIRTLANDFDGLSRQDGDKNAGLSCRCILD